MLGAESKSVACKVMKRSKGNKKKIRIFLLKCGL